MKVLVIGSGGREHAIVWKIKQSKKVSKIFCAPGNGGISQLAECVNIGVLDRDNIIKFAKENLIDMVFVAPDDPLAEGMVDALLKEGIKAIGPTRDAAIIEWSKSYAKDFMKKYNIPTATYEVFNNSKDAKEYLNKCKFPTVIKADGLALGKGVYIVKSYSEALEAINNIMEDKIFGAAGERIIFEEYLEGKEITVMAFTDGKTVIPMVSSQDHKRAYDNDEGLNTGGMGTFSPSRIYSDELAKVCMDSIYLPTIKALEVEGRIFKGIIYFGLMLTNDGIKVIEYNSRFGDPETQVVLPRLETDIVDIFEAIYNGNLSDIDVKWNDQAAICVIAASGGYPLNYEKGFEITGLDHVKDEKDIIVFHAGTSLKADKYYTNGGRVFGLTAIADNIDLAREKAYKALEKIKFKNMHFRTDIGKG